MNNNLIKSTKILAPPIEIFPGMFDTIILHRVSFIKMYQLRLYTHMCNFAMTLLLVTHWSFSKDNKEYELNKNMSYTLH